VTFADPSSAQHSDHRIEIAGEMILPGHKHRVEIPVGRLPTRTPISLPVIVINGKLPGPKLWLSAAIHGDEINGVEIIRQVMGIVQAKRLKGTLIAVPVVNIFGFLEQSRYLPDRRDLNRSFPGSSQGSLASRLAYLFMKEVVSRCTHGIDLHTAAQPRINLPQIRANLLDEETYRCAKAFGSPLLVHSTARDGSLREAASQKGIPILLYEGGEALRFDAGAISIGVEGILRVMAFLEMYPYTSSLLERNSVEVRQTKWVRASKSGVFHLGVSLGEKVGKRQSLGLITDAFGEDRIKVRSPIEGMVIGHVQNPLVNQGDGIVHLAVI
jgi:predicted deacylase